MREIVYAATDYGLLSMMFYNSSCYPRTFFSLFEYSYFLINCSLWKTTYNPHNQKSNMLLSVFQHTYSSLILQNVLLNPTRLLSSHCHHPSPTAPQLGGYFRQDFLLGGEAPEPGVTLLEVTESGGGWMRVWMTQYLSFLTLCFLLHKKVIVSIKLGKNG